MTALGHATRPDPSSPPGRRGWLNNGNRPGDFLAAPRCGAKTRHRGACRGPAMANGRCRMHGGASTGPRTPEGLARSRRARWTHGARSRETAALRAEARLRLRRLDTLIAAAGAAVAQRTAPRRPAAFPAAHGVHRSFFYPSRWTHRQFLPLSLDASPSEAIG